MATFKVWLENAEEVHERFFRVSDFMPGGEHYHPDAKEEFRKHLVKQEIDFWESQNKQVSQDDFDFICNRRGFTEAERKEIYDALKRLGIGNHIS